MKNRGSPESRTEVGISGFLHGRFPMLPRQVGFWECLVMSDNEFETKENKIQTPDKMEPQCQYSENNVVVTKKNQTVNR